MPCSYRTKDGKHTCQFNVQENELQTPQSRPWCLFHLPIKEKLAKTAKAGWKEDEINNFNQKIFDYIESNKSVLNLTGVVFPGEINFPKKSYPQTIFIDAIFNENVSFDGLKFTKESKFNGVTFNKDAYFHKTEFVGDAIFTTSAIHGLCLFEEAVFEKNAYFNDSQFHSFAAFNVASFKSNACFKNCTFAEGLNINNAKFHERASFENASVSLFANFAHSYFKEKANFKNTIFFRDVSFKEVTFTSKADFIDTSFNEQTDFYNTKFKGPANFQYNVKKDEQSKFFKNISFNKAEFFGKANFSNRSFSATTSFRNVIFHMAPEFHNCSLHQDIDFYKTEFNDIKSEHSARAYRTLKLATEKNRAHDDQARFYALEQQAIRNQNDTPQWVKIFSWLYEITSNYGQNALRPLIALFLTFLLFFVTYVALSCDFNNENVPFGQLFGFTVEQSVRPFAVWIHSNLPQIKGLFGGSPTKIQLIATLQSLLSIIFIALFILAVRWRFKRG